MNPIELSLFSSRIEAVCDEMGAVLRRSAFSPNIKDRLDYSCAVFDAAGELCAQAAHIPVHLGSMAYAMRGIVSELEWAPDDCVVLNDPYLGGTHLPDVTLISPVYVEHERVGFVANRAHHADIGADSPGSMPISRALEEEGQVIPPSYLCRRGILDKTLLEAIVNATRNPIESHGDFAAQLSAVQNGVQRLQSLAVGMGVPGYAQALVELNDYAARLAGTSLERIPDGVYRFTDYMDDDGSGQRDIPIQVAVTVAQGRVAVDFDGTSPQVPGNINAPLSVAAAAVFYVFRCLMPTQTPACAGTFRPITLSAPVGCLVNAVRPAAVAAGNVETSTRMVDAVMGALAQAIPDQMAAASHGSMNNLAMGSSDPAHPWDYYETIGGGMGASHAAAGGDAVQTHMTNTLNTPIEALEMRFPLRVRRYAIRRGSGGHGLQCGGDGIVREYEFLQAASATLLTERRFRAPWGLAGGEPGKPGINRLNGKVLGAKVQLQLQPGDRLTVESAGGGGYGDTPK